MKSGKRFPFESLSHNSSLVDFIGNDIEQSDVFGQLGLYNTVSDSGGPIFGGPFIQPRPILVDDAVAAEVAEPAPVESRKKRSIWWPGGGGSRHNFGVSITNQATHSHNIL